MSFSECFLRSERSRFNDNMEMVSNLVKRINIYRMLSNDMFLKKNNNSDWVKPCANCFMDILQRDRTCSDSFVVLPNPTNHVNKKLSNTVKSEFDQLTNRMMPITNEKLEKLFTSFTCTGIDNETYGKLVTLIGHPFFDGTQNDRINLMSMLIKTIDKPEIHHYNALLQIYVDNNMDFSPDVFIQDMFKANVFANDNTLYLLLTYYCSKGLIYAAEEIIRYPALAPKIAGVKKEDISANMIIGYANVRQFNETTQILKHMSKHNIKRTWKTNVALLYAAILKNDLKNIDHICKKYLRKGKCKLCSYTVSLFSALASEGHLNQKSKCLGIFSKLCKVEDFPELLQFLSRLINLGHESVAMKLLPLLERFPTATKNLGHYILLQRLTRRDNLKPLYKNLTISPTIDPSQDFELLNGFSRDGDIQKIKDYIELLVAQKKHCVKTLHFWPIFAYYVRHLDLCGILSTVEYMISQCQISPCFDTLKEFILPYTTTKPYYTNILLSYGISEELLHNAAVHSLLRWKRHLNAVQYVRNNQSVNYLYNLLFSVNIISLVRSLDAKAFLEICDHLTVINSGNVHKMPLEKQLLDVILYVPQQTRALTKILEVLVDRKVQLPLHLVQHFHDVLEHKNKNRKTFLLLQSLQDYSTYSTKRSSKP